MFQLHNVSQGLLALLYIMERRVSEESVMSILHSFEGQGPEDINSMVSKAKRAIERTRCFSKEFPTIVGSDSVGRFNARKGQGL
jgi:hypothetical protein